VLRDRLARRPVPYLLRADRVEGRTIAFLPSSDAVVAFTRTVEGSVTVALPPHVGVVELDDVVAVWSLAPHWVKAMLGPPAALRGRVVRASDHPALRLFDDETDDRTALSLLHELRASLTVTPDEHEFERLWWRHRVEGEPLPSADRRVQRLMVRFAGQSLTQIAAAERLAATLRADRDRGGYNVLGLYADGSHYARQCRRLTGRAPSEWRNVSHPFYGGDVLST
jgi:hypothetical protein